MLDNQFIWIVSNTAKDIKLLKLTDLRLWYCCGVRWVYTKLLFVPCSVASCGGQGIHTVHINWLSNVYLQVAHTATRIICDFNKFYELNNDFFLISQFAHFNIFISNFALWVRSWTFEFHKMRWISWLAAKPVSFSRRTLLHGVSK
jgi:hypothetical protein